MDVASTTWNSVSDMGRREKRVEGNSVEKRDPEVKQDAEEEGDNRGRRAVWPVALAVVRNGWEEGKAGSRHLDCIDGGVFTGNKRTEGERGRLENEFYFILAAFGVFYIQQATGSIAQFHSISLRGKG